MNKQVETAAHRISGQIATTKAAIDASQNERMDAWLEENARFEEQQLDKVVQQDVPPLLSDVKELYTENQGLIENFDKLSAKIQAIVNAAAVLSFPSEAAIPHQAPLATSHQQPSYPDALRTTPPTTISNPTKQQTPTTIFAGWTGFVTLPETTALGLASRSISEAAEKEQQSSNT
ncbi:hypothetical protein ONS96_005357 [Cadophora gregata f. sp. sojae]|nr:hypothetical protein ONS96_005357 [Cadophora gregata f. sp. sojae]